MRNKLRSAGELESAVMEIVWELGDPATVRRVMEELASTDSGRPPAYTTVMTVMDRLHRKGWLQREAQGRAYRYWPASSKSERVAILMGEVLDGSVDRVLVLEHFAAALPASEVAALRAALADTLRAELDD